MEWAINALVDGRSRDHSSESGTAIFLFFIKIRVNRSIIFYLQN